jgi:hypothetical protein
MTTHPGRPTSLGGLGFVIPAAIAVALSCSSPTVPVDSNQSLATIASIQVRGAPTVLVGERSVLDVTVRNSRGRTFRSTSPVGFSSSNEQVVTVSNDGVMLGVGRGKATISVKVDSVTASLEVAVRALLFLSPERPAGPAAYVLYRGDSLRLTVGFADVNGAVLAESPVVTWESSDPMVASVDRGGLLVARGPGGFTVITASTGDVTVEGFFEVAKYPRGVTGTIRFAHAVEGVGPITFHSNRLAPVTLTYGQWADLPVDAGYFYAMVEGLPADASGVGSYPEFEDDIAPDTVLSLYATASASFNQLTPAWSSSRAIPADSGLVRLVQGSAFPVVYLLSTGGAMTSPDLTAFYGGTPSPYYMRPGGAFDLVLQGIPQGHSDTSPPLARLPAHVSAGHAVTLVLTGTTPVTAGYLAFPDR